MGGSSQPQKVTQEVTQTNLPKYAEPYVMTGLQSAQGLIGPDPITGQNNLGKWTPYTQEYMDGLNQGQTLAPRVAGLTGDQQGVVNNILSKTTPEGLIAGQQLAGTAGLGALMTSGYNPSAFTSQTAGAGTAGTRDAPILNGINSDIVQQYMSPYAQNVIDVEKREAIRDAQKKNLLNNLATARQGAYGGARNLLAQTERERALGYLLGDIQSKGLQSAYDKALGQFNTEQGLKNQTNIANMDAYTRAQIASAQNATQAAIANQEADLKAQQMAEQSKQFGATQGLKGLELAAQSAQTMGNIGQMQGTTDVALLKQQMDAAGLQQQIDQQALNQQYNDFLKAQALPWEQLQQYSNIVRGNTIAPGSTSTTYGQAPSALAQTVGGLGTLATAAMMK